VVPPMGDTRALRVAGRPRPRLPNPLLGGPAAPPGGPPPDTGPGRPARPADPRLRPGSPFTGAFTAGLARSLLPDELSIRRGRLWLRLRLLSSPSQPAQDPRPVGRALPGARIGGRFSGGRFRGTSGRLARLRGLAVRGHP